MRAARGPAGIGERWTRTIRNGCSNSWICWIESAKKAETRTRRIERTKEDLSSGKRRPCCWPGCRHR
ncbi:MAG TPA: YdeI/OmpD-associated family protein [Hyphomicrobium sp.]|nr:YdeI/OmpD-associated family protein [Hyphomicrobium sp.]